MQEEFNNACLTGNYDMVKELLEYLDPSFNQSYPLQIACDWGCLKIVDLLLQDPRINPAARDNAAIGLACQGGYIDIVVLLLQDSRVNPATTDNFALRRACYNGYIEIVKMLLADLRIDCSNIFGYVKSEIRELLDEHAYKPDSVRYTKNVTEFV